MHLLTLGGLRLEDGAFSRPKPLLLLTYATLEGPQPRRALVDLLWPDDAAAGGDERERLRKRLGKLSVALTQLRKEGAAGAFPDEPGLDPLPSRASCDALRFEALLDASDDAAALALYRGPFLHDLRAAERELGVSAALADWITLRRERYAGRAREALLRRAEAAQEAGRLDEAAALAERAWALPDAPELEPDQLARLRRLSRERAGDLLERVDDAMEAGLEELSETARTLFLALELQSVPNLTALRGALGLSLQTLSDAHEELLLHGLVDVDGRIRAGAGARGWLERHPAERLPLLLRVARASPPDEAFEPYRTAFRETGGFGGVGDVVRARAAYLQRAGARVDARDFAGAAELLAELRAAERRHDADPTPRAAYLEAYALERLGRFGEAFGSLKRWLDPPVDADIAALASALHWRLGRSEEAQALASGVIEKHPERLWAHALAVNTLGYLAGSRGDPRTAAAHFKRSAALFRTAGAPDRWSGSLSNHAGALGTLAARSAHRGDAPDLVAELWRDAETAHLQALDALREIRAAPEQLARALANLGTLRGRRRDRAGAEAVYREAAALATSADALEIVARIHINVGSLHAEEGREHDARSSYRRAVDVAATATEPALQGQALANLALLDDDPDTMEVGLGLLERGGRGDLAGMFREDYRTLLERRLERARQRGDDEEARSLHDRLRALEGPSPTPT